MFDYAIKVGGVERSLLFSHGQVWNQARRFTAPSFNRQNVNAHIQAVWQEANNWVEHLLSTYVAKEFEFKDEAFLYTLRIITKAGFGIDSSDHDVISIKRSFDMILSRCSNLLLKPLSFHNHVSFGNIFHNIAMK